MEEADTQNEIRRLRRESRELREVLARERFEREKMKQKVAALVKIHDELNQSQTALLKNNEEMIDKLKHHIDVLEEEIGFRDRTEWMRSNGFKT